MTSLERILAVCQGRIPDRVPFLITSRVFGMRYSGLKLSQAYKDPDAYVGAQLRILKDFELDGVFDIWCTPVVDEALGARMEIPEDDAPWLPEPFINDKKDISKLKTDINPRKDGRMPYFLDLVSRLKKTVGSDVPVISWISQPFRSACMLRGTTNLYMDLFDDPAFVKELIGITYKALLDYGKALIDAGADIICTSNPVANMDCISRKHYEEFSHPYTKNIFGELKKHGAKAIEFHTCGRWDDRFDLIGDSNVDIAHIDKVDLQDFKTKYSAKLVAMGNVKSVQTIYQGTQDQVKQETYECLRKGAPGGRYILSCDCEAPRDTPAENMKSMLEVLKNHGSYPLTF